MRKQLVLVEALVPGPVDSDAHPEHPIYIPVEPPPEIWGPTDPRPTHPIFIPCPQPPLGIWGPDDPRPTPPIYFPVDPPGDWDLWGGANEPMPTPPIYIPIPTPPLGTWGGAGEPMPTPPIVLPPMVGDGLTDEQKEKLVEFLLGNLPPYEGPPSVQPV